MLIRTLGALVTGPAAFFLSGLLDVLTGVRMGLVYLW
jgi:hypothetical protein